MKLSTRIHLASTGDSHAHSESSRVLNDEKYNDVKSRIHLMLVDRLELTAMADLTDEQLETAVRNVLNEITMDRELPLNNQERARLVLDIVNEITGFGPLETYLNDESVQDILVNGPFQVLVEKNGVLYPTPVKFRDDKHLMHVIDKIVSGIGRRIDESSPMVDARLPDGSRVNVIIPPLSLDGPVMSIRKFGRNRLTGKDLMERGSMSGGMFQFLKAAIRAKLNILVSGGTGAGKTTLLNVLSENIPDNQRIITIEDSAELRLEQPHVVRLESRPANVEGRGEVTLTDLVKNSLRMRPDRIIVGETRGAEVMDMLQAMSTGHPGSMSTVHANSPADALSRIQVMAGMGKIRLSEKAMQTLIAGAIDLIVQLERLADGRRRVVSISEINGIRNNNIVINELFVFERTGMDTHGNVLGRFAGRSVVPDSFARITASGIGLDSGIFHEKCEVC